MQVQDVVGTLGLPANVAAILWAGYGGAKLWQTLKGSNGNGKLEKVVADRLDRMSAALVEEVKRQGADLQKDFRNGLAMLQLQLELDIRDALSGRGGSDR